MGPKLLDAANINWYVNNTSEPLFEEFTEEEKKYTYFQQYNDLAHHRKFYVDTKGCF